MSQCIFLLEQKKKKISSGAMALGYVGTQCQNDNATPSCPIDVDTCYFKSYAC